MNFDLPNNNLTNHLPQVNMLEYFAIKKYRESTAADGTSISKEPLTPLLAPQDERYLAQVIDDPEGTHSEPESVIFNGSPPQAPIATVDPPVKLTTENVQGAAPPTEGDGDWKDTLKEKWGYLEALGTVTATRIEKAVVSTIGMDKGKEDKGKGKAVDTNADGVEVNLQSFQVGDNTDKGVKPAVETGPHSESMYSRHSCYDGPFTNRHQYYAKTRSSRIFLMA